MVEPGQVLVAVSHSLISTGTETTSIRRGRSTLVDQAMAEPKRVAKLVQHLREHGLRRTIEKVRERLPGTQPLGYSCAGTVVQVGAGVETFAPQDRVACAGAGLANHAERVVVPHRLVARVPDPVSLRDAPWASASRPST
jgi:threonine dehydrogenase-like Zn-dependent dehydrogenase